MEIRQLKYFIAVAECMNFTDAAKQLYVDQPTVSRQIARLEKELGFTLFIRTTHSVQLTASGKVFLKEAVDVVNRLEDGIKKGKKAEAGEIGELNISFLNAPVRKFLPNLIMNFREKYPSVELNLNHYQAAKILEKLKNDETDLAFTVSLGLLNEDLKYKTLYSESYSVIVNKSHPLSSMTKIRMADLSEEPFVFLERKENEQSYDSWLAHLRNKGLTPRIVKHAETIDTLLLLIEAGVGISVMPKHLIAYATPFLRFIDIEDENDDYCFDIVAAWKRTNQNPAIPLFIKELDQIDFTSIFP